MSVRVIIILLALPLFLLLAAVNSLLLYKQEIEDVEQGLRGEALAAAVTVAEFAHQGRDPFAELASPGRLQAVRDAGAKVPGLDALYLAAPDGRLLNLLSRPAIVRHDLTVPPRATIIGDWRDDEGQPLVTAMAPAGAGAMVVADIDAGPLARRSFHLMRLSLALIGGSTALAILLGFIVSRRVTGEFRRTRAIIDAHGGSANEQGLAIREVRDLADAIGLIDKSVATELAQLDHDGAGDLAIGIRALRRQHFPDLSEKKDGIALSIRSLPAAAAGAFYLRTPGRIVLGEIPGAPAQALASAIALRDHVLTGSPEGFEQRLALAQEAFGAERRIDIALGTAPVAIALRDDPGAAAAYAARNPDLDPDALVSDLAILFPDAGIIVAAKPA